jgi:hypothetical protein
VPHRTTVEKNGKGIGHDSGLENLRTVDENPKSSPKKALTSTAYI